MQRLIRPLAAAAICLAGLSPLTASGSPSGDDLGACRAKDQVHVRGDHWTEIKAPKADSANGEGQRKIVDWATPLSARSRIYATNGTVIKVSADAGCTWNKLENPRELSKLQSAQGKASQDVYTNLSAPGNTALWAASYDDAGGVQHPHVYAATFTPQTVGNPEWSDYSTGLPATGKPVMLAGSAVQASLTYVVIEGPGPDPSSGDLQTPARHLYVSYDPTVQGPDPLPPVSLGLTWKELSLPAGFSHLEGITPTLAGRGLWIRSGKTYTMTPDTLADSVTWAPTATAPGQVTAVDTDFSGNSHVVYAAGQAGAVRDYDAGGKLTGERLLPTAGLFVHGTRSGVHAVSGPKGVYGYDTRLEKWVAITPKGVPAFTKMQMPYGRLGRIVIGQAKDTFYRFDTYVGELFAPPPPLPQGIGDFPTLPGDGRTTFTPVKQVVTVTPGELHDVPVKFDVGPAPNPLDVYFLLDTTGSMQPALDGLRASIGNIAERLHKALGKNACFGLGDFQDFYPGQTQHTYVRDLPITCDKPVEAMKAALGNMPPPAGGGDIPEAQTIALTQSVTGSGQQLPDPPVDKHLQAGFRAEAYKVIVLISDSSAKQVQGYPTKAATINTLNVADVKVVSALVSTDEGDHDQARADMEELAQGTQTLAPPQGVDCDGNHLRNPGDLEGGDPLVCDVGGGGEVNIGPAIVGLLLGVVDPGTLAVDVHDSYRVVQQIKGQTSKIVNLKQSNALSFDMPVRCTAAQDGKDLPVTLVPTVSALPVGLRGEVTVRCRSNPVVVIPPRPVEEPEVFFAHPQHPPVAVAVVQPPIPQAPVSNINPNAGFSNQEEQQYQLAAVGQDASQDDQEQEEVAGELAMSDWRARDAMGAGSMLAGAAVLSAAAGLAYRRRLQRATRPRTVHF